MLNKSFKLFTSLVITATLSIGSAFAAQDASANFDIKQYESYYKDGDVVVLCAPYPLCKERIVLKSTDKSPSSNIHQEKNYVEIPLANELAS